MWREPALPDQVDYMTPEEFVIAQSPSKMNKLIDEGIESTFDFFFEIWILLKSEFFGNDFSFILNLMEYKA